MQPLYLDDKMIPQPAAALELVARETIHSSDLVDEILVDISSAVREEKAELLEKVLSRQEIVSNLYNRIQEYLSEILYKNLELVRQMFCEAIAVLHLLHRFHRCCITLTVWEIVV